MLNGDTKMDYIKCQTKEIMGNRVVHVVSWTIDKTIGDQQLDKVIYDNASYGPEEAIRDVAERLNISNISKVQYGLHGYAAVTIMPTVRGLRI